MELTKTPEAEKRLHFELEVQKRVIEVLQMAAKVISSGSNRHVVSTMARKKEVIFQSEVTNAAIRILEDSYGFKVKLKCDNMSDAIFYNIKFDTENPWKSKEDQERMRKQSMVTSVSLIGTALALELASNAM